MDSLDKVTNKYKDENIVSRSLSIISLLHITLFILLIPIIWLMVLTIQSFNEYGWAIQHEGDLPFTENCIRSWFLFLLVLFCAIIFVSIYVYWLHKDLITKKWIVFAPSFFPLLFPASLIYVIKNHYLINFWYFLWTNRVEPKQISHKAFWQWITKKTESNKLIRNTILFYFTLIIFTIGFVFININGPSNDIDGNVSDYFIFNTMSFFTQQNNIMCWVFLLIFGIAHKKIIFKDNILQTYLCAYITVVGVVALTMIGPYIAYQSDGSEFLEPYNMTKFLWLHLVNEVFFIWFTLNTYAQTYNNLSNHSWKKYFVEGSIYPVFYGLYLYIVPFFSYYSVYGFLTNLNPYMYDKEGNVAGNPFWIFGAFGVMLVIYGSLALFRWLNDRICKNHIKCLCR